MTWHEGVFVAAMGIGAMIASCCAHAMWGTAGQWFFNGVSLAVTGLVCLMVLQPKRKK